MTEEKPMAVLKEPVFEEPTLTGRMSKYERVLAPLMDEPEQWAKIGEYSSPESAYQAALNLRKGRYRIVGEPDDWEFVAEDTSVFAQYTKAAKKSAK